jgi:2-oxoglutarate dehydrogenase E1 component
MSQGLLSLYSIIIAKHKNPRDIYAEKLLAEGAIDANLVKDLETKYKARLG